MLGLQFWQRIRVHLKKVKQKTGLGIFIRHREALQKCKFPRTMRKFLGTFLKILNARITVLTSYSGTSWKSKIENWFRNFHTASGSSSKITNTDTFRKALKIAKNKLLQKFNLGNISRTVSPILIQKTESESPCWELYFLFWQHLQKKFRNTSKNTTSTWVYNFNLVNISVTRNPFGILSTVPDSPRWDLHFLFFCLVEI